MVYIVICAICAALAAAVFALCLKGHREYIAAREEIDRTREERDIIIEFLHKTAEEIGGGADKMRLYRRFVRATAQSCGAMSACVYEKQPDGRLKARAIEGLFPPQTRKVRKPSSDELRTKFLEEAIDDEIVEIGEGIIGAVEKDRKGVLIKEAENDPRVIKHGDESLKVRSIIAVPMIFGGKLYGVLAVANPISGKPFTETDFSLARSLGEQAGLALNNISAVSALILKKKMEFDLRLASSVQQYLLPSKIHDTDSLEFAVKYFPQQLIGGDFYDFFRLPDGKFGIVVGDVSGKGVSAAIIMAICQTKLRYIARASSSPADTLKALNAEMVVSMRTDMFITMIYAIIDKNAAKITLARAGHEPALLYRAENQNAAAEKIKSSGMAVGMVSPDIFDESISDVSVDFHKGDVFVVYTDGITEAANRNGDEFSTARLASAIPHLAECSAERINDTLISAVEKFTEHTRYADDLTLVCVKHI